MNLNEIITYLLYIMQLVEKILLRLLNRYDDTTYSDLGDLTTSESTAPAAETTA